jgi:hypothetical protein
MTVRNMSLGTMTNTQPNWVGDFLNRDALLPGGGRIDATLFAAYPGPVTVALTAPAAIGSTSLTVTALSAAIPAGTSLNFGIYGKYAVVATTTAAAATALPVLAIDQALLTGDTATFAGSTYVQVPSGTFVSRTFAQRAAGAKFHPAINTDEEFFLTGHDVPNALVNDEVSLVRPHACVIKENLLPGFTGMSAALKTVLRAQFMTTIGSE